MKKSVTLLFAVFAMSLASSVICIADDSKWVGLWSSNEFTLKELANTGTITGKIAMKLFSDNYSIVDMTFNLEASLKDGMSVKCRFEMLFHGKYKDDGGLKISPYRGLCELTVPEINVEFTSNVINGYRMSSYEMEMVREMLVNEFRSTVKNEYSIDKMLSDRVLDIGNLVKSNNIKLVRKTVEEPFYYYNESEYDPEMLYLNFKFDRIEDAPLDMYVRGAGFYDENIVGVGLFDRNLQCCYVKFYDASDGEFQNKEENCGISLADKVLIDEYCNHFVDTELCPESGVREYPYYFSDGSQYTGEWKSKKPSGRGKKTFADGNWYEGLWSEGKFVEGEGRINQSGGAVYEGKLKGWLPNGEGVKTCPDGVYSGTWFNGVLEKGSASLKFGVNNTLVVDIVNNEATGKGQLTCNDGSFTGIFDKSKPKKGKIVKKSSYQFEGEIDKFSLKGECRFDNGNIFNGEWKDLSLNEGTVTISTQDNNYPKFNGTVAGGKLVSGNFQSKNGFSVSSNWGERTSSDNLTIIFKNGDKICGIWDVATGQLVEASMFEYIWADGVKCTYVVGKKCKLSKPAYSDASGTMLKPSSVKNRIMMNTDGEAYTLLPIPLDYITSCYKKDLLLPGGMFDLEKIVISL